MSKIMALIMEAVIVSFLKNNIPILGDILAALLTQPFRPPRGWSSS